MFIWLQRANVLAASLCASTSIVMCSTYELWVPHPVGHLYPMISVVIAAAWSFHCWQLGLMCRVPSRIAIGLAAIPLGLSLIAGVACWFCYQQQITQ